MALLMVTSAASDFFIACCTCARYRKIIFQAVGQLACEQVLVNPLITTSDWNLISPYNITPESSINVIRLEEMITNLGTLDCLTNSPYQHLSKCTKNSVENRNIDVIVYKALSNVSQ